MPGLKITTAFEWHTIPANGNNCYECKGLIIGAALQLVVFIDYEPIYSKYIYCENCYELIPSTEKE